MSKLLKLFIIIVLLFSTYTNYIYCEETEILNSQMEALNIQSFLDSSKKYTENLGEDFNINEIFSQLLAGNVDNSTLLKRILNIFGKELRSNINIIGLILVIIIIHSILKSISENLEDTGVSKITYYVQYILIITLVLSSFSQIIGVVKDTIQNLVGFLQSLLPILITLMLATGSFTSASIVQPILLFLITFIGNFVINFILPLVLIGTAFSIISKLSSEVKIDKIAKFLKSTAVWILGVILTLFVTVLSLEGTLTSSVDGVTAKTAKAAVSTVIPVVGKILGDAVDAVIGCSGILKNAVGIIGVLIIIAICIAPIIKLSILTITYYLVSSIAQPISDSNIVGLLEQIGDTFKTMLAILISISVMLIIGITIVIKISNSALMYR